VASLQVTKRTNDATFLRSWWVRSVERKRKQDNDDQVQLWPHDRDGPSYIDGTRFCRPHGLPDHCLLKNSTHEAEREMLQIGAGLLFYFGQLLLHFLLWFKRRETSVWRIDLGRNRTDVCQRKIDLKIFPQDVWDAQLIYEYIVCSCLLDSIG
jgi:hypothetical protein